ncbi:MAG: hypothetical protein IKR78_01685 [Dehalococcoidales bacterium]|nr:hypothetical protein [Dehalococcoidales bacterium]
MNKSLTNSFILFIFVLITTVFVYVTVPPVMLRPALESYIAFILASIGIVYALSYLYYDKIDVTITDKRKKILRSCAIISFISLFIFLINALYAHVIYPAVEEFVILNQVMLIGSAIVCIVSMLLIFIIFFVSLIGRPQSTLQNGDSQ